MIGVCLMLDKIESRKYAQGMRMMLVSKFRDGVVCAPDMKYGSGVYVI